MRPFLYFVGGLALSVLGLIGALTGDDGAFVAGTVTGAVFLVGSTILRELESRS